MALTRSAVDNGDLLRLLEPGKTDVRDLARASGRRSDNLGVTLRRLAEDGLAVVPDTLSPTDTPTLTLAGKLALQALDVADGFAEVGGEPTALHHELRPNPENPRKAFGGDEDDALAEAIHQRERVEQPLVVGHPDANGVRTIYEGERRWRAVGKLIAEGRRDRNDPIAITVRDDDPDLIFDLSLNLNQTGKRLNKVEEARALHAMSLRHNWGAPELARRYPSIHKRTIEHALQVMRDAAPEDIAAYEADPEGFTWQRLRESVQTKKAKPALELTPKLALALVELAHAIHTRPAGPPGCTRIQRPQPGGAWHTLGDRNLVKPEFTGDGRMYARITGDDAAAWLKEIGFEADPNAALFNAEASVLGSLEAAALASEGQYASDWLNLPEEGSRPVQDERSPTDKLFQATSTGEATAPQPEPKPEPDEAVTLYADLAGKRLEGAAPAPPPAPELPAEEAQILLDLSDAMAVAGRRDAARNITAVETFGHFTDRHALALTHKKMIATVSGPRNTWLMHILPAGTAWLDANTEVEAIVGPGGYVTSWLNPPTPEDPAPRPTSDPAPSAEALTPPAPTPIAPPIDAAQAEAAMILEEVEASSATSAEVMAKLLDLTGLEAPFTVDRDAAGMTLYDAQGRDVLTVDVNGSLPDALAVARCTLIARALNVAFGAGEP